MNLGLTLKYNFCILGIVSERDSNGSLAQLGEHLPYKQGVIGSSPIVPTKDLSESESPDYVHANCMDICGPVVQLVRTLACHARGRGFEPLPGRH